jgi:hypothetical protein
MCPVLVLPPEAPVAGFLNMRYVDRLARYALSPLGEALSCPLTLPRIREGKEGVR